MRTLLACLILTTGAAALRAAEPEERTLTLKWKDRFLEICGPHIPGGPIRTHYLEAYCRPGSTNRDWKETVIPHESRLLSAADNGKRIEIQDKLDDGVIVTHVIKASDDEVQFTLTATNPTDTQSLAHWAQPCMRVDGFVGADPQDAREVYPPYIRHCFLMIDGKLTRLPSRPWATEARYEPGQVYAPRHVNRDDVNPRPLSELVPSSGLTGCYSRDEAMILAVAWHPYQEIFQGVITCMHNDFRIGGLKPGETKNIRGKIYLIPADERELLERFKRDFPEQTSSEQ